MGRTSFSRDSLPDNPDHPHARGENIIGPPVRYRTDGPSPRTWGERPRRREEIARIRTIPTHVGRTSTSAQVGIESADHPHARGENNSSSISAQPFFGPSPRTWGERVFVILVDVEFRTIPTHVGRTLALREMRRTTTDHPHARGENGVWAITGLLPYGPSPRTWGEHSSFHSSASSIRTIPTHVGRTPAVPLPGNSTTDHPHARGENVREGEVSVRASGPSPRTWGERCD